MKLEMEKINVDEREPQPPRSYRLCGLLLLSVHKAAAAAVEDIVRRYCGQFSFEFGSSSSLFVQDPNVRVRGAIIPVLWLPPMQLSQIS